jgi:hypothetical protein
MASTNSTQARRARLSCRHTISIPTHPGADAPEWPLVGDKVDCPTCPPLKDGGPPRRTVKQVFTSVPTEAGPSDADVAEALGKLKAELESPEMAKAIAAPLPEGAHTNRVARLKAAEREAKALGQWKASGASNGRPATPNLDAVEAERQAGARTTTGAPVVKATNGNGTVKAGPERSERHRAHVEARKACGGKRGPGRRLPEAEFQAYVANARHEHGPEGSRTSMEYAYWVDRIAFSRATWVKAWEAAGS